MKLKLLSLLMSIFILSSCTDCNNNDIKAEKEEKPIQIEDCGFVDNVVPLMVYEGVQALYIKTTTNETFEIRRYISDKYSKNTIFCKGMSCFRVKHIGNYLVIGRRNYYHSDGYFLQSPSDHDEVIKMIENSGKTLKD